MSTRSKAVQGRNQPREGLESPGFSRGEEVNTRSKTKTKANNPAKKTGSGVPAHPLMLDGKSWDRQKTADFICARIATSSKSIAKILAAGYGDWPLPDYTTFMQWLREDEGISHQYARAKDDQADYMADETLEIADDDVKEPVIVDGVPLMVDGVMVMARSNVAVQHAKLRVDTRKWLASKLKPKKYGDKVQQEVSGPNGGPVEANLTITPDEAYKRMLG